MKPAARAVSTLAAAGLASTMHQEIATARDSRRFSPPGRMVDIGGRRLHLETDGDGSPVMIIIPATADNVLQWLPV